MLTEEQIKINKDKFIELINSMDLEEVDMVNLNEESENYELIKSIMNRNTFFIGWLTEETDFFEAPASTKYHGAYKGGLCEHSLAVYNNLLKLIEDKGIEANPASIKLIALLHDLSKVNLYEETFRNKKVYSENGSKCDGAGNFDWVSIKEYSIKDFEKRLVYGNHEQNSERLIRSFFHIKDEDAVAVLHHMGGMSWDSAKDNICEVYNRFPIACLLHLADMLATYIDKV